jgi:hypothetical protein
MPIRFPARAPDADHLGFTAMNEIAPAVPGGA